MNKIIITLMSLCLIGCGQTAQRTPVDDMVERFEQRRNDAAIQYGLRSLTSRQQDIASIDCMVFQQAIQNPPQNLGEASAWFDSANYNLIVGCNEENSALTHYETARRTLRYFWQQELNAVPEHFHALAEATPMGQMVQDQIRQVATMSTACIGEKAVSARSGSLVGVNLHSMSTTCNANHPSLQGETCRYAWRTTVAHQSAIGERDDPSMLLELLSRYLLMYNSCTPSAAQEYVQFHSTVPPRLFEGIAYRLRIPVDPMLACTLRKIQESRANRVDAPAHLMLSTCAQEQNMLDLYVQEAPPHRLTPETIADGYWLFDPTRANENPQEWTLGTCEQQAIQMMHTRQLNLVSPRALRNYCRMLEQEEQRRWQ